MQISVGASQDREMVEGVCVFFAVCTEYWTVFISFGTILQVQGQCHFFGKYDLTMDKHCRRFCFQGEGAADLLEVLGHSQELKVVNFYECSRIPAVAWQKLRGAKWPQLKKVDFEGCLARKRNG